MQEESDIPNNKFAGRSVVDFRAGFFRHAWLFISAEARIELSRAYPNEIRLAEVSFDDPYLEHPVIHEEEDWDYDPELEAFVPPAETPANLADLDILDDRDIEEIVLLRKATWVFLNPEIRKNRIDEEPEVIRRARVSLADPYKPLPFDIKSLPIF